MAGLSGVVENRKRKGEGGMVKGLSKQPVIARSFYQLAIVPAYIQGRMQKVFEWLYSHLGNTRSAGNVCNAYSMYAGVFQRHAHSVNARQICAFVWQNTETVTRHDRPIRIAGTWHVYDGRSTRPPKFALKGNLKSGPDGP